MRVRGRCDRSGCRNLQVAAFCPFTAPLPLRRLRSPECLVRPLPHNPSAIPVGEAFKERRFLVIANRRTTGFRSDGPRSTSEISTFLGLQGTLFDVRLRSAARKKPWPASIQWGRYRAVAEISHGATSPWLVNGSIPKDANFNTINGLGYTRATSAFFIGYSHAMLDFLITSHIRALLVCVPLLGLHAQEISGRWCVEGDPQDCYVLRVSGETFQGESFMGNRKIADATGLYRNSRLAASFIRRDNGDVGVWIATMDSRGRLTGATLNPDGGVRWRGDYRREGSAPVTPADGGKSAGSASSAQAGRLGRVWRVTEGVGGPGAPARRSRGSGAATPMCSTSLLRMARLPGRAP